MHITMNFFTKVWYIVWLNTIICKIEILSWSSVQLWLWASHQSGISTLISVKMLLYSFHSLLLSEHFSLPCSLCTRVESNLRLIHSNPAYKVLSAHNMNTAKLCGLAFHMPPYQYHLFYLTNFVTEFLLYDYLKCCNYRTFQCMIILSSLNSTKSKFWQHYHFCV